MKDALLNLDNKYRKVELFFAIIAGIIILVMMAIQASSIISRFIFQAPFAIAYDSIRLLFIASLFLGVSYVQALKEHVGIEIVVERFSKRVQQIISVIGYALAILLIFLIVKESALIALQSFQAKDYTMGLAKIYFWPFKMCIPIGMSLLLIRLILDLGLAIFAYDDRNKNMPSEEEEEGVSYDA